VNVKGLKTHNNKTIKINKPISKKESFLLFSCFLKWKRSTRLNSLILVAVYANEINSKLQGGKNQNKIFFVAQILSRQPPPPPSFL